MSTAEVSYRIFPLGDAAITIDFGNRIDLNINKEVVARFKEWKEQPLPGMIELVPAYSSLTIFYDMTILKQKIKTPGTCYDMMKQELEKRLQQPAVYPEANERSVRIPVCY